MRRDDSYRGFETWFNDFKMRLQMVWVLTLILGVVQPCLFVLGVRTFLGELDGQIFGNWVVAKTWTPWQPAQVMTFHDRRTWYRMWPRRSWPPTSRLTSRGTQPGCLSSSSSPRASTSPVRSSQGPSGAGHAGSWVRRWSGKPAAFRISSTTRFRTKVFAEGPARSARRERPPWAPSSRRKITTGLRLSSSFTTHLAVYTELAKNRAERAVYA